MLIKVETFVWIVLSQSNVSLRNVWWPESSENA